MEGYRRFIDKATYFDYIEYGSLDVFELSFRVVRFPLSESTYECNVTNLPADEYPPERIKAYLAGEKSWFQQKVEQELFIDFHPLETCAAGRTKKMEYR